jgi:hypothetical protein
MGKLCCCCLISIPVLIVGILIASNYIPGLGDWLSFGNIANGGINSTTVQQYGDSSFSLGLGGIFGGIAGLFNWFPKFPDFGNWTSLLGLIPRLSWSVGGKDGKFPRIPGEKGKCIPVPDIKSNFRKILKSNRSNKVNCCTQPDQIQAIEELISRHEWEEEEV